MPTSNSGSPEQLFQEIANSAIKRINLGIDQSKNSSEPIYILPPLKQLPELTYHPTQKHIPLKRQPSDMKPIRVSFHPLTHLAITLNCLPPLMDFDLAGHSSSAPCCGWFTSYAIEIFQMIHPVWLAEYSAANYTLIHGYRTYGTFLRQNISELVAVIWKSPKSDATPRHRKHNPPDWHAFMESSTLPVLADIFSTCLYPHLFNEKAQAQLIFWLDTLGLLSLLFQYAGKGSSKRAALEAINLPESTYNFHTRDLRKRQRPIPCPPPPSSDDQKQGLGKAVAPTTVGTDSSGPAMTSTDNGTNTELPPEEEEKKRSDDGPKYGTPLF
jgi:hypothetical protein